MRMGRKSCMTKKCHENDELDVQETSPHSILILLSWAHPIWRDMFPSPSSSRLFNVFQLLYIFKVKKKDSIRVWTPWKENLKKIRCVKPIKLEFFQVRQTKSRMLPIILRGEMDSVPVVPGPLVSPGSSENPKSSSATKSVVAPVLDVVATK